MSGRHRFRMSAVAAVAVLLVFGAGEPAAAAPGGADLRNAARAAATSLDKPAVDKVGAEVAAAAGQRRRVTAAARSVCYNVHLQDVGWQGVRCNGEIAGTTGQSRRMEAIVIAVSSDVGSVCYNAHVQDVGWQGARCNGEIAGTTGQSRRMEAIAIAVSTGNVCYNAHVQDVGWQGARCNGQIAGTTGQSRRMEAIVIVV